MGRKKKITISEELKNEYDSLEEKCKNILINFLDDCRTDEIVFDDEDCIGDYGCYGEENNNYIVKSISYTAYLETYGIHKTLEIDYGNNEGRLDISLEVLIWLCCDITDNWKELVKKYKKKSSHQIDLHCPDCGCKFIRDKNPDFEKYCRLLYDINDPEKVPIYKCSNCGYNVFINNNIYDSKLKNFPHLKS